jgi:predicted aldo/keto reductase-like oxidoreductase
MSKRPKELTRRQWLKGVGTTGLGSLLLSTTALTGTEQDWFASANASDDERLPVPTRPFGKTGVPVSILALGGMFDIQSNQLLLKQALKWGVTYWDTADCYGRGKSEGGIGKFFSKYPHERKRVFLVSKSDDRDPEGMTRLLNRSLERMHTNYIDLYFVHGISDIDELNEDTRQWAKQAKALGKIKFFGFSTHRNMESCMLEAAKLGWIDGIMMTYNFRLMHTEKMKEAVAACVEAGIGLTAMKTQGGGPVRLESETEFEMAGRFLKQGFTDKQAKLKAVWESSHIASICSQMPNMTILMSNVDAATNRNKLSAECKRLLERFARETRSTYCAGCGRICESALNEQVPVSDIMRHMMYSHHYTYQDEARAAVKLPKQTRRQLLTVDFSEAEKRCPQEIAIGKIMKEAAEILT